MIKDVKLLGFRITAIEAKRNEGFEGKLEISPSINLSSIEKAELSLGKQEALEIKFDFGVSYKTLGHINLKGTLILGADPKIVKESIKQWKDKKLDKEVQIIILNVIMQKSSLKALQIEEEIGLPPHVQLPRLSINPQEEKDK